MMPTEPKKPGLFSKCWPFKSTPTTQIAAPSKAQSGDGDALTSEKSSEMSGRRKTERARRRVAITAESSEQLASARWKSAFEAMRKQEAKTPVQIAALTATLKKNASFVDLEDSLLAEIVNALRSSSAAVGEEVIKEGDVGDAFYLVSGGALTAIKNGTEVAKYGPGDSFGELALMYDCTRQATVKVTAAANLWKLGRVPFRQLVLEAMTKNKAGLEKQLGNVALLKDLGSDEISRLAEAMETVSFEDGQYIAEIGQPADSLFLILAGEVACHKAGETELRLAEGAVFGESCLSRATNPTREANVVAVGKVKCATLNAVDTESILGPIQRAIDRSFCKKVINSINIFSSLSIEERAKLFTELTVRRAAAGEKIIEQGAMGDTFYIIKHGTVDVVADGAKVKSLSSGTYFGERSLLKGETTTADIVAADSVELMCLSKSTFEGLLGPMQKLIDREVAKRDKERGEVTDPKIAWSDLDVRNVLGEGSFGSVRLCVHKPTKTAYALKQLHKGHLISTNQVNNTINEKRIMKMCVHPGILACHGSFNAPKHVSLLLGLAQGGELFTRMSKVGTLSQPAVSLYVAMVASALGFLSIRSIAHRDLKLENLLFDDKGYLKLVDFGFAKIINERTFTFCGTPDYLAPEILSGKGHNWAVDWWTLGILAYEMLHGEPPFAENEQMATFKRISGGQYRISSRVSKEAADLIQRLLVHNPAKRLGMLAGGEKDILKHPLCKDIDTAKLLAKQIKPPFVPNLKDPTDTSNFDDYGTPSSGKKYDKYLDAKYDATWEKEFS